MTVLKRERKPVNFSLEDLAILRKHMVAKNSTPEVRPNWVALDVQSFTMYLWDAAILASQTETYSGKPRETESTKMSIKQ